MSWLLDSKLSTQLEELELLTYRRATALLPWAEALAAGKLGRLRQIELRNTGYNTSSGVAEVLQRWVLRRDGSAEGGLQLILQSNIALYSDKPRGRHNLMRATEGLPAALLPRVDVEYIGGRGSWRPEKLREALAPLDERFETVTLPDSATHRVPRAQ